MPKDKFGIALVQNQIQPKKEDNVERARGLLEKAAAGGASLAVLPELFNAPYDAPDFVPLAEPFPGGPTGDHAVPNRSRDQDAHRRVHGGAG